LTGRPSPRFAQESARLERKVLGLKIRHLCIAQSTGTATGARAEVRGW
jgi:hypothetical protein